MLQLTFFKPEPLVYENIKQFLIDSIHQEFQVLDENKKISIKKFIVDHVNSMIESNGGSVDYSPSMIYSWSDKELISRAYQLMEYQGLLELFNSKKNQDKFENNYVEFMGVYSKSIQKAISNGNFFIAYLHVVKLSREMNKLNKHLMVSILSNLISDQIDNINNELILTSESIIKATKDENQVLTCTLIALILHTRASIFYNANNEKYYDLTGAKHLLSMTVLICDEGEAALAKIQDKSLINFYTLNASLLPTLPYQSFSEQKKAILETGLNLI